MDKRAKETLSKGEEDSESSYSVQESEEVSNDPDQSGSSIQGSEEFKEECSQSESSVQSSSSEKVRVFLEQAGKYNKIKDENANIKTLLGKRPAGFPGMLPNLCNLGKEGVKKLCDDSNKVSDSGLPVISDVWSEKNPTVLSGLFGHKSDDQKKIKVEEEWQQTFKISELPDPKILFGDIEKNSKLNDSPIFRKPTKPAPIPLAKVSWKPPVLTGENSLDEKLLSGPGNAGQNVAPVVPKPRSEGELGKCSFLKCDSFKTCGGGVVCVNQGGNPENIPESVHPPTANSSRAKGQKRAVDQKPPPGMPPPHVAQEIKKKVPRKLEKPEKSHINRVIKHTNSQPRSTPVQPRKPPQPRNTAPKPRNVNTVPRTAPVVAMPENAPYKLGHLRTIVPPHGYNTNPPQQFEFALGSHLTGGNMLCAKDLDSPSNQVRVPADFIKGLMKSGHKDRIDPAVDIVTSNDMQRFLNVQENKGYFSSYNELRVAPPSPSAHAAIKALLTTRSQAGGAREIPTPAGMPWKTSLSRPPSAASSSSADVRYETKSLPSPRRELKSASKSSSPTFAEKIAMFKAEIPQTTSDDSVIKTHPRDHMTQPSSILHRRNTIGADTKASAGCDEMRKSWLASDSLLPPNMPLSLNIPEKKSASTSKQSSDTFRVSPRTDSASSSSSCHPGSSTPLHIDTSSLLPPNFPLSLESPKKRSPQRAVSPRKQERVVIPNDARLPMPMMTGDARLPVPMNLGSLLPPGMPWQLNAPERRIEAPPSGSGRIEPLRPVHSAQISPTNPRAYGPFETSRNLQYTIPLSDGMKKNLSYHASPRFPTPYVLTNMPNMMPASPEMMRVRPMPNPPATITSETGMPQSTEISPSRSKDDGYSTSSSLQESPNQPRKAAEMIPPVSPSGARSGVPPSPKSGGGHVCNSPKKRKFVASAAPAPELQGVHNAEGRAFYNIPMGLVRPLPHLIPLEALSPLGSPLRRNIGLDSHPMNSPYRRIYEPSEPAYQVQLVGVPPASGNQTGSQMAGVLDNPVDSTICAADSTEKGDEPLNLVVAKSRAESVSTDSSRLSTGAVDMRTARRDSAMDLSTHRQYAAEQEPIEYDARYPYSHSQNYSQPVSDAAARCYTHNQDDTQRVHIEPQKEQLHVAKDSGVDVVNHFLQSMHSIRYKESNGETCGQNTENREQDNDLNTNDVSQGNSGNNLLCGEEGGTAALTGNDTSVTDANITSCEQSRNQKITNVNSNIADEKHVDLEVSGLRERELVITKPRKHVDSVSTVASDCHFCGPGQGTTSYAELQDSIHRDESQASYHSDSHDSCDIARSRSKSVSSSCSESSCSCCKLSCGCKCSSKSSTASDTQTAESKEKVNPSAKSSQETLKQLPVGQPAENLKAGFNSREDVSTKHLRSVLSSNENEDCADLSTNHPKSAVGIGNVITGFDNPENEHTFDIKVLAAFPISTKGTGTGGDKSEAEMTLDTDAAQCCQDEAVVAVDNCSVDSDMELETVAEWFVDPQSGSPEKEPVKIKKEIDEETCATQNTNYYSRRELAYKTADDAAKNSRTAGASMRGQRSVHGQNSGVSLELGAGVLLGKRKKIGSKIHQNSAHKKSKKSKRVREWKKLPLASGMKEESSNLGNTRRASGNKDRAADHQSSGTVDSTSGTDNNIVMNISKPVVNKSKNQSISGESRHTTQSDQNDFTKLKTKIVSEKEMSELKDVSGLPLDSLSQGEQSLKSCPSRDGNWRGGVMPYQPPPSAIKRNFSLESDDISRSSSDSNLVIDESVAVSSGDNSNQGNGAAAPVTDNLHLLAEVSTEYGKTQHSHENDTQLKQIQLFQKSVPGRTTPDLGRIVSIGVLGAGSRYLLDKDFSNERRSDRPKSRRYRALSANGGRQLLPEWIEEQVDIGDIPGLKWVDRKERIVRIPWRHSRSTSWKQDDCTLFERWAIHTCKHLPGDAPNPKRWKTNFRCALNLYAVRMDHGKDFCNYKLFESAITGAGTSEKKEKRPKEVDTNRRNSGLDQVLDSISNSPRIPTVIGDLVKQERTEKSQNHYDRSFDYYLDDSSHIDNNNGCHDNRNVGGFYGNIEEHQPNSNQLIPERTILPKNSTDNKSSGARAKTPISVTLVKIESDSDEFAKYCYKQSEQKVTAPAGVVPDDVSGCYGNPQMLGHPSDARVTKTSLQPAHDHDTTSLPRLEDSGSGGHQSQLSSREISRAVPLNLSLK